MARVLLIGLDPDEVDFSDPGLPPGVTAEFIRRGIAKGLQDLRAAGHNADSLYIPADPKGLGELVSRLRACPIDCAVIGGGVRVPPQNLELFEALLNRLSRLPNPPLIALVDHPDQSAAAVARAMSASGT